MKKIAKALASILAGAMLLSGCAKLDLGEEVNAFPDFTAWTTYGTGTATYADLAAAANTISNDTGAQIRILTSDTAVGRLSPLRNEQAVMSRTGDEYMYSFNGAEDFSHPDWGPQDVRVVWTPTAPHALMTRANTGITTPMDLKGKRVPRITANPSVNNKISAYLAYAGLTWDDVKPVNVAYSEQPAALQNGKIDVLYQQVYGSSLFELESAVQVQWLELDPEATDRVEALQRVSPAVEVGPFEGAPGQAEGESDNGFVYPLPIVTYAETSDSIAYYTAKAFQDEYPQFADATATTKNWDLEHIVTMPVQVPFHPGTVKFLEENGKWSPEAQERNEALIAYGERMREAWPEFLKQADTDGDLKEQWREWKKDHVQPLP
ncbi:TAXI family TRAP transporter solute-binding subunit [Brevibacterium luteolum]|uniref:TAXI family TRAP transporter solute-binding subunit n=1 Tax=Brevibacterium luteolum TaxID=199591 RepID=UPI0021AFD8B2|nr:TAXI family TRAP transporter solute-binding subunit [Brevibacterium luteolum]MCT1872606.1 TAXI family TRAP transporter solute-binding subunit [Brevibacterium luteolum]MCT1890579.1 TAXI family TRAP transporter solute-binding subunit [Brevibacterium luteolum]MCT1893069.1 TAXI family TRAP transporter solute-binding subunit [Brevibacterium luteolum]MCT1923861.1 TAXI family TRAP transporter solute-binding subunit [Brevibacterium luteolum]